MEISNQTKSPETSGGNRLALLGAVLFIATVAISLGSMGFGRPRDLPSGVVPAHLDPLVLWAINLALGFGAGALMARKRWLLAGLSGASGAAVVTGFSLLYFGWRGSIVKVELVLPLIVGAATGLVLYLLLKRRFPASPQ